MASHGLALALAPSSAPPRAGSSSSSSKGSAGAVASGWLGPLPFSAGPETIRTQAGGRRQRGLLTARPRGTCKAGVGEGWAWARRRGPMKLDARGRRWRRRSSSKEHGPAPGSTYRIGVGCVAARRQCRSWGVRGVRRRSVRLCVAKKLPRAGQVHLCSSSLLARPTWRGAQSSQYGSGIKTLRGQTPASPATALTPRGGLPTIAAASPSPSSRRSRRERAAHLDRPASCWPARRPSGPPSLPAASADQEHVDHRACSATKRALVRAPHALGIISLASSC